MSFEVVLTLIVLGDRLIIHVAFSYLADSSIRIFVFICSIV